MSPLALLYNDRSILENFHASSLFQILQHRDCNPFEKMDSKEFAEFRKAVISNILATDMKLHFEILAKYTNRIKMNPPIDPNNHDDRLLLMRICIKCSDVSNLTRSLAISQKWTERVVQEFYHQGDLEREAGLPISPFMDRTQPAVAKSQVAFIEFILRPLFGALCLLFPQTQPCLQSLESNLKHWQGVLKQK